LRQCRFSGQRSVSQGDKWNALINRYITVIPLIGHEPSIGMQKSQRTLDTAPLPDYARRPGVDPGSERRGNLWQTGFSVLAANWRCDYLTDMPWSTFGADHWQTNTFSTLNSTFESY
jgi:hypothetical protein